MPFRTANQKAGTHRPPRLQVPPSSSSSSTPPPFSLLREHADSRQCLCWSVRGPESRDQLQQAGERREGKSSLVSGKETRQRKKQVKKDV